MGTLTPPAPTLPKALCPQALLSIPTTLSTLSFCSTPGSLCGFSHTSCVPASMSLLRAAGPLHGSLSLHTAVCLDLTSSERLALTTVLLFSYCLCSVFLCIHITARDYLIYLLICCLSLPVDCHCCGAGTWSSSRRLMYLDA